MGSAAREEKKQKGKSNRRDVNEDRKEASGERKGD